jgi:hypothetical protein
MKIRSTRDLWETGSCRMTKDLRDQLLQNPKTRLAAKVSIRASEAAQRIKGMKNAKDPQ